MPLLDALLISVRRQKDFTLYLLTLKILRVQQVREANQSR